MAPNASFDAHIRNEELRPVYVLLSTEDILLQEAVSTLRKQVLTAAPDFNRDELRASEVTGANVAEAAATLPMMAPRRWVHLASVHQLKSKDIEPLLAYVKNPSLTTVLCLSGHKLDKRYAWAKHLTKHATVFSFEPPKQRNLTDWILRRATSRGYDIAQEAAALLADLVGTNVGDLDRSLDKLWTFVGAEGTIAQADVETLVAPTRVHSIFDLADAIGDRDLGQASLLLRNSLDGGEAALRVLAMITRQFRLLLRAKQVGNKRGPDVARELGVAPFLVGSLLRQAKRYQERELVDALRSAARADQRIKSTPLDHGVVLDRLLVDVMGSGTVAR